MHVDGEWQKREMSKEKKTFFVSYHFGDDWKSMNWPEVEGHREYITIEMSNQKLKTSDPLQRMVLHCVQYFDDVLSRKVRLEEG